MKQIYMDFFPRFSCLMGTCPDTCCKAWEVVIDADTLQYYQSVEGVFGEKIRQALTEKDGEWMFDVSSGRCPLLTGDGLCSIQKELGAEHLCKTCAEHPRFIEQYGMTEEITLSISCPAAAELLLGQNVPVSFMTSENDLVPDEPCDLDAALYFALCKGRDQAFRLIRDARFLLSDRICFLLLFTKRLQQLIDRSAFDRVDALCERFSSGSYLYRQQTRLRRMRGHSGSFTPLWMLLQNMEHLTSEFPQLLVRCNRRSCDKQLWNGAYSQQFENLCVYFLFRYFKKAVNDRKLLQRVCMCVFHLCSVRQLFLSSDEQSPNALIRLCSLYSKEVEHSDENCALLLRTLTRQPLGWRKLVHIV